MNYRFVYICDLTYTQHGVVSEFVPYGIGCIKSYFHAHSAFGKDIVVRLVKYPEALDKYFFSERPAVVAFSNYIWNSNLAYTFAQRIKEFAPHTLVIFGGPNYPLEDSLRERWLTERLDVDFYVTGEGEAPFTKLLDNWYSHGDLQRLKEEGIVGCHALVNGKLCKGGDLCRLSDLNVFPSPYLMGYLDEFLDGTTNIPLIETTRGCPFTCAYCERGASSWKRLTRKSPLIFESEIEAIAYKTKSSVLLLADSNFGMYPQDVEIARILKRAQIQYGYPEYISVSTGKNAEDNILKCVKILGDSLPITASVQSLDPEVLRNIKRHNISTEKLISMGKSAHSKDSITRSEIILALPGDTKEKHFSTIYKLLDAEMDFILPYTLMLLDGTELNTTVFRQRYRMETRYRLSHRCYGTYPFGDVTIRSGEIEEVVVGLEKMTFHDYLDCRSFALTVSIFYSDGILFELFQFLKIFGVKASTFVAAIHENRSKVLSKGLSALYQSFEEDTKRELWNDKDALASLLTHGNEDEIRDQLVGYNILFKHRAKALLYHVEDISRIAFRVVRDVLPVEVQRDYCDYLDELLTFNILKKKEPFEYKRSFSHAFYFNFDELEKNRFEALPLRLTRPKTLTFHRSAKQVSILSNFPPTLRVPCVPSPVFLFPKCIGW